MLTITTIVRLVGLSLIVGGSGLVTHDGIMYLQERRDYSAFAAIQRYGASLNVALACWLAPLAIGTLVLYAARARAQN